MGFGGGAEGRAEAGGGICMSAWGGVFKTL